VTLDFAALPPEVNSARMYAGAGSESLITAATAWTTLATELSTAATSYRSVVAALTGEPWVGPSSTSMAAAVAPYVAWMNGAAAQARQAATQLESAAAAYEAALAATVSPGEIEVNRALLAALTASNLLGQNTSAIAATEAQYAEMWARDAAAMYGYAGASSAATTLTPFTAPPQTSSPAGTATQAAAVGQAGASSAGTAQAALSQMTAVPSALNDLASGSFPGSNLLLDFFDSSPIQAFESVAEDTLGLGIFSYGTNFAASGILLTIAPPLAVAFNPLAQALSAPAAAAAAPALAASQAGPAPGLAGASGVGGPLSAGLGEAASVGGLSVPPSWGAASPAIRLAASALPATALDGMPEAGAPGGGFFGGMPPMGPVASVVNAPRGETGRLPAGARHKVIPALPGETGMDDDAAARWTRPAASAHDDAAVGERDELNQLRKAMADVTRQRDVLKRTAATLIKEAAEK
jgi:PPE-repeat protein